MQLGALKKIFHHPGIRIFFDSIRSFMRDRSPGFSMRAGQTESVVLSMPGIFYKAGVLPLVDRWIDEPEEIISDIIVADSREFKPLFPSYRDRSVHHAPSHLQR